jgi:DNA-directed RNA polymerase subunit L
MEDERKTALEIVQVTRIDKQCVTLVLLKEDHTLGNSL